MFAAGAYITKEPEQLSMIAGGDLIKWFDIALLVVGTVLMAFDVNLPRLLRV